MAGGGCEEIQTFFQAAASALDLISAACEELSARFFDAESNGLTESVLCL